MAQDINDFLPQGIEDRQRQYTALVLEGVRAVNEYAKAARDASTALGNSRALADLARAQAEAARAQRLLAQSQLELQRVQTEAARGATEAARAAREQARAQTEQARAAEIANRQAIASQREADRQAAAATRAANAASRQSNAYTQLRDAYNRAANAAKEMAARLGLQDAQTVQAVAHARQLSEQLLSIERAVGQNQRNVGNYASGFSAFGNAINQIGRELPNLSQGFAFFARSIGNNFGALTDAFNSARAANVNLAASGQATIPIWRQFTNSIFSLNTLINIGVTLFVVYGQQIFDAVKALFSAETAASRLKKNQDALNATVRTAYKETGTEIATLDRLYRSATDVTLSLQQRKIAVDRLQEDYPSYFKNLNSEVILAGKAADTYTELRNAIILAGRARAIRKATEEFAEKDLELEQKANEALEQRAKLIGNVNAVRKSGGTISDVVGLNGRKGYYQYQDQIDNDIRFYGDLAKVRQKEREEIRAQNKFYIDEAEKLEKATAKLQTDRDTKTLAAGKKPPKPFDATNETVNVSERIFRAQAERSKQQIQLDIDRQKAIVDNEKASLDDRLAAYQQFTEDRLDQIDVEKRGELFAIQANLDKIAEIENKAVSKRTNEEKGLLLQRTAFEEERKTIIAKYAAQESAINAGVQADITKIVESEIKKRQQLLELDISQDKERLNQSLQDRKVALAMQYRSGELSESAYQQALANLQDDYDRDALTQAKHRTFNLIQEAGKLGADTTALLKKYADIEKALATETAEHDIKEAQRVAKTRETLNNKLSELQRAAFDSYKQIGDAQFARQRTQLEAQGANVDANAKKEIDAVNRTMLSQEEKQAKIAEIEARAQGQREALAERQRQLQRRQAIFDRQATITQIVAETALAVVRALGDKSLVGPARIPFAIAVGALGALQVANALAQPLPAYEEGAGIDGRPLHQGGRARVGEGNKRELVIEPGRTPYAVQGDQVRNLKRGTAVIPEQRLHEMGYAMLSNGMVAAVGGGSGNGGGNRDMIDKLDYWGRRHERAMKRGANVSLTVYGDHKDYFRKRTSYGHS